MKKLLFLLCVVVMAFVSCQKYDDSELLGRIDDLEESISDSEDGDGLIVSMDFLAKHNPLNIAVDIKCAINGDGKIHGRIPNIVSSKQMIPTFEFVGQKVLVDTVTIISGETILDFSKPVTMSVVGYNGAVKDYTVELMAFSKVLWREEVFFVFSLAFSRSASSAFFSSAFRASSSIS